MKSKLTLLGLLALTGCFFSGGCNSVAGIPAIQKGMTEADVEHACFGAFPPATPESQQMNSDGTISLLFKQQPIYGGPTYILVNERNGIVESVSYTGF